METGATGSPRRTPSQLGARAPGARRAAAGAPARALACALALAASPSVAAASSASVPRWNPNFPVFGGGSFMNVFGGDETALANASAHIGWSLAVPLLGQHVGGRKGLWIAGLSWIGLSLVQESLFHAPPNPGPSYPAEVRTDLITRIIPCAALLVVDLLRGGGRDLRDFGRPPEPPPGRWPLGLDAPIPPAAPAPSSAPAGAPTAGALPAGALPLGALVLRLPALLAGDAQGQESGAGLAIAAGSALSAGGAPLELGARAAEREGEDARVEASP